MLDVQDITKQFYNILALNQVSLSVSQGEVIGLLGPNGAGKSTLFKIIAGLLTADKGRIRPTGTYWPKVAYKPDRLIFPDKMTVQSYLEMMANLSNTPRNEVPLVVAESLERVKLTGANKKKIGEISKGMRQRLGLAQALLGDPDFLLLDEPTNGLDPEGQVDICEQIGRLQSEGKTILISSHQLHEITKVCSQLVILSRGEVVYQNSMDAALALQPKVIIEVNRDLSMIAPWLRNISAEIQIQETTITLPDTSPELRRKILTLLLGAGYDVTNLDHHKTSLAEIYTEVVQ